MSAAKPHIHTYDEEGNQLCCTPQEGKIYTDAGAEELLEDHCCAITDKAYANANTQQQQHTHSSGLEHDDEHAHDHAHGAQNKSSWQLFLPALISFSLLLTGLALDQLLKPDWFKGGLRLGLYIAAYLPVAWPVIREMFKAFSKKAYFSEFTLMVIATLGAFAIGEYPEAVAVMLFYSVGEVLQTLAVRRAKGNIQKLLDQRPDEVSIVENDLLKTIKAQEARVGQIMQIRPGEKLGLDGELLSESASFNTAALTGESKPDTKQKGETVLAGMINLNAPALVKISTPYTDSKLSRILALVQDAQAQKAPTELFIRRFAKIYTPIVVLLAGLIVLLPFLISISGIPNLPQSLQNYSFPTWLYRALIFLVISCPCALVISIPLGYFGGIGAASRHGILVKGSNFLDVLASVKQVVMDKTGTMTEGIFKVEAVQISSEFNEAELLQMVNTLESKSTHPVASAIHAYVGAIDQNLPLQNIEEIPGHGMKASIQGKDLLVGNFKLLDKFGIAHNTVHDTFSTLIAISYGGKYAGYISIADRIKDDAQHAVHQLKKLNVVPTMLSGDKTSVVMNVAERLGIPQAFGDLLPEDKVNKVKEIKARNESVAFVGDGVNDAPVVALSDVGVAMGGLGSDATIETADVVIQDDKPSKIPMAIHIGKKTKQIVLQNIALAFIVKAIVLILGAGGLATMWEAVFADVGVALLAILNAVRIQKMKI